MMTIQCIAVLRKLKSLTNNSEDDISFLGGSNSFCLLSDYKKCADYSKYKNEINGILDELSSNGYIVFTYKDNFRLTHKAVHSQQTFWLNVISIFVRSFLLPIIVAFITTLITLWLQA